MTSFSAHSGHSEVTSGNCPTAPIIGIGLDLVDIARFRQRLESKSFRSRVFTVDEVREAERSHDPGAFLAGRFAGKEAVMKCLGCGIRQGLWFSQISITTTSGGGHGLELCRTAATVATQIGPGEWQLMISAADGFQTARAMYFRSNSMTDQVTGQPIHGLDQTRILVES